MTTGAATRVFLARLAGIGVFDPNGDQVFISSLDILAGAGGFTLDGGLCFTFTPGTDFTGKVKAGITLCDGASSSLCIVRGAVITIQPINDPPVIVTSAISVNQDEASVICLTVTDVENDPAYFTSGGSQGGNATITTGGIANDLCMTYTPTPGFFGIDLVDVAVCEISAPTVCSMKTISIDVIKVNHAPGIFVNGLPGGSIALTTQEDQPVVFCFESVDPDGDDVALQQVLNLAGGGTLVPYENIEFCFTFTPARDFNGLVNWEITVCDNGIPSLCGTLVAMINVTPQNDPPLAVDDTVAVIRNTVSTFNILNNDLDIDGDSIILTSLPVVDVIHGQASLSSDGIVTYTSDRYYKGPDSLVYEICDNGSPSLCAQATATFVVGDFPLRIYEGVSPNGDGVNDYWRIEGIDYYSENNIRLFDRYNNLVYEARNYNNEERVWRGEANQGLFRGKLPDGVYFYYIKLASDIPTLSGFIVLKNE